MIRNVFLARALALSACFFSTVIIFCPNSPLTVPVMGGAGFDVEVSIEPLKILGAPCDDASSEGVGSVVAVDAVRLPVVKPLASADLLHRRTSAASCVAALSAESLVASDVSLKEYVSDFAVAELEDTPFMGLDLATPECLDRSSFGLGAMNAGAMYKKIIEFKLSFAMRAKIFLRIQSLCDGNIKHFRDCSAQESLLYWIAFKGVFITKIYEALRRPEVVSVLYAIGHQDAKVAYRGLSRSFYYEPLRSCAEQIKEMASKKKITFGRDCMLQYWSGFLQGLKYYHNGDPLPVSRPGQTEWAGFSVTGHGISDKP